MSSRCNAISHLVVPFSTLSRAFGWLCLMLFGGVWVASANEPAASSTPVVVTGLNQWWQASQEKNPKPITLDVVVDVIFYDAAWRNMWILGPDAGSYVAIGRKIPNLKTGHRIRMKGTFVPTSRLSSDDVEITILGERPLPAALPTSGDLLNYERFQHRIVRVDGVVESQQAPDTEHVRLSVLSEGQAVEAMVLTTAADVVPKLPGAVVSVQGVYVPKYAADGRREGIALWVSDFKSVEMSGWLSSDERLKLPLISLPELAATRSGQWVRVEAQLKSVSGKTVTISNGETEVVANTAQTILPEIGQATRVVARVKRDAAGVTLDDALFPDCILAPRKTETTAVVTSLNDWWAASITNSREPVSLDATVDVTYVDEAWKIIWVIDRGTGHYIELGKSKVLFKRGERIRLEGLVNPGTNLNTDSIGISVVGPSPKIAPPNATERITEIDTWKNLPVRIEGFVESQQILDDHHFRMNMIVGNTRAEVVVLRNGQPAPEYTGSIVSVEGVFAPKNAADGSLNGITLWVSSFADVQNKGVLENDPRFHLPVTEADRVSSSPRGEWVRISGEVQDQDPGVSMVVRDRTGQIFARAAQLGRAGYKDTVDLVGRVSHEAGAVVLSDALFVVREKTKTEVIDVPLEELRFAAQVIALSPSMARSGLPVQLRGAVLWSHPSSRFIYVADATRGVRVNLPSGAKIPAVGSGVTIAGATSVGSFSPEVDARVVVDLEVLQAVSMPDARLISLEQALTGSDEARWVELQGYVRSVANDGLWTRLELLTSGGEFRARVPRADALSALKGAVVRVRGVCAALTNERRQLTGIELWVPVGESIQVDQAALADPFALPLQLLASLQQFNVLQANNRPVRIGVTVVHHIPGRLIFGEDQGESIRILSSDTEPLRSGERIEAVGLPGRENGQLVLREALYRRIGETVELKIVPVDPSDVLREDLEGRLASVPATLLGSINRGSELRLSLRSGEVVYDAVLLGYQEATPWPDDSQLKVTGVYQLVRDEYRNPHSLQLQVRSIADVTLVKRPSWWTAGRALGASGVLAFGLVLGLAWVRSLRRRVQAQTKEISCQLAKVANLEARHREIIENASDFIFTSDSAGHLTSFNPAGVRLTGYSAEEALKLNVRDLIAPEDHVAGLAILDLKKEVDGSATFQCRFKRRDGELVWVEISARLLLQDGQTRGILAVVRDFTARHRYEEALTQARDAAEASARAKSTFLANMSHEIRTPMNGVIGMSNLLLETKLDGEQKDFAETIRNSAESLLTVLNDILDFSKIEAGKLQFETLDFDLADTVEGTMELLATRAAGKGIELAVMVPDDLPHALVGDPGRLRQVLLNLVGNAIKFTSKGEVVVRVSLEQELPNSARLLFEITDTGIGLSEESQKRLFQPFIQADSSTTRRFGGTGLGLAICRQLVEMMEGTIGVRSELGKGSTFWFTVTLPKSTNFDSRELPQIDECEGLGDVRIAIVDDNQTNRNLLAYYVSAWGAYSQCFENGVEALAAMQKSAAQGLAFDIALLDYQMPEMDGFVLANEIRRDPLLSRTKSLLLTSLDHRFEPEQLAAKGIVKSMSKPIRKNELRLAIIAALPAREANAAPMPVSRLQESVAGQAGPAYSFRILVAEDNVVNQRVARLQLEKLGHRVDVVANGLEVLEAVERGRYDVILMDCQMPEMDGYEATKRIRQGTTVPDITVVAMTANAMQGDREVCLAAGMNDYISKPMRVQELAAVLGRLGLEKKRRISVPPVPAR